MLEECKSHSYRMRTNSYKTNVSACVCVNYNVATKYVWFIIVLRIIIAMIRCFYYCITYTIDFYYCIMFTIDTVSASYQQQVKEDRNVKEQSTETELVLSFHDKQGTIIDS